jgi:DNA-binding response OmpR family regulator
MIMEPQTNLIRTFHTAGCPSRSILVADDSKEILELLKLTLSYHGFRVVTTSNGQEALDKFDNGHFDLVLTDLCMPGIDGNTLARHIKYTRAAVPVIALTASPTLADKVFDSVVIKPFLVSSLVSLINALLLR